MTHGRSSTGAAPARELIEQLFAAGETLSGYSGLPASARAEEERQLAAESERWHEALRAATAKLRKGFHPGAGVVLPEIFEGLFDRDLARIDELIADADPDYFCLTNDRFIKNLALLRHRLIPCGAEYACPYASVPLASMRHLKGKEKLAFLAQLLAMGGRRPCLELHMHQENTEDFSPAGWEACFGNLRVLLERNPAFRGVFSISWFLDPALAELSPHLAYLREGTIATGGKLYFAGEDGSGSGALQRSAKRRAAFAAGSYMPRNYLRLWSRRDALRLFPLGR